MGQIRHLESDASLKVLLPIVGLLGGLGLAGLRVWLTGTGFPESVVELVTGAVVGSAIGMCTVLASAFPFRRVGLRSVRSLAVLGFVAGVVLWFAATYLRAVLLGLMR